MLQFHFYSNVQFETNPKKCCRRRIIYARTKVFHGKRVNIFIILRNTKTLPFMQLHTELYKLLQYIFPYIFLA